MATSAVSTPRSVLLSADCLLQRSAGAGAETFLARLGLALGVAPLLFVAAFAAISAASRIPRRWIAAASRRSRGLIPLPSDASEDAIVVVTSAPAGHGVGGGGGGGAKEDAEADASTTNKLSTTTRTAAVSLLVTLFTIYPTVMQETLLLFSCIELDDGESYLLESMDMRCGGARHTAAVASLGGAVQVDLALTLDWPGLVSTLEPQI